jgi:hypothetical protein
MGDAPKQGGDGLRGQDQQQGALRDTQGGTYGVTPSELTKVTVTEHRTEHPGAQPGADVRPKTTVTESDLPAGLRHERKGPLNPSSGRNPLKN